MATNFGLNSTGFIVPTFDDILFDIQTSMQAYAPQLSFDDNKLETAFSSMMANQIYCMWQEFFSIYNNQNPNFASGCHLNILGKRAGLTRFDGETDAQYRLRIGAIQSGSGALSGSTCFDKLYSRLFSIGGVTDVQINLNDTAFQAGVLPPNSYEVMVLGGDSQEIAQTIWNCHPIGITLSGNTFETIVDCTGVCRSIYFTRPKLVPIFLDFYVERTGVVCGCPTEDTSIIKDAIQNELESDNGVCFTRIGRPVHVQDFFPAIYSIQGIGIKDAYLSRDGLCADQQLVTLKRDEVPVFSTECCNITFSSSPSERIENGECDASQTDSDATDYCYRCPPASCMFSLEIVKEADKSEFTSQGEIITYTFTVTNTGVAPLTSPIIITDDKASVVCDSLPATGLPVGDSITCTAIYEATYQDAIDGGVTNKAQAISGDLFSPCVELTVPYTGPDLIGEMELSKALVAGTCNAVGNILTYQYVITNTGTVPITTQPIVSDDKIPGIICPPLPAGGLLPGSSITATADTVVTQEMLDDGECCNNARASANTDLGPVVSNAVTVCIECSEDATGGPTSPGDILIQDCANSFPYATQGWVSVSGPVTLSANGTDAPLGLLFSDDGDNTGTITAIGPVQNGIMTITGTDIDGNTSEQTVIINCDIGSGIVGEGADTLCIPVLETELDNPYQGQECTVDITANVCGSTLTGIFFFVHNGILSNSGFRQSVIAFIGLENDVSSVTISSPCAPDLTLSLDAIASSTLTVTEYTAVYNHFNCSEYTLDFICL